MKPVESILAQRREIRHIERGRLFRKYFLLILALVCGGLLISGAIGVYFSYQENKVALSSVQREKAIGAAAHIEDFVRQIERQLKVTQSFTSLAGPDNLEQRRLELHRLGRISQEVTDVAQIDAKGRELVMTSRLGMERTDSGLDRSGEPAFKEAKPDQTWFGPVYFRKETEPYMQIAVCSKSGEVTVADVNLKFMWDVVTRIKIGKKGKAYVVDGTGHLVADPDIGLVLRKTDLSRLPQVEFAMRKDAEDSLALMAQDTGGSAVLTAYASIESLGWKVFVEQPAAEVYETLNAAILRTGSLIVAGLLLSALVAMWLARSMVRPIRTLQEGAARIGAGDLEQKISVKTGDELQALADQFNDMAARLQESYAGLERKVEERTEELKESLDQQTAISEILRIISGSPADVRPVLQAVAERAARICEAPDARIFLVEDGMLLHVAGIGELGAPEVGETRAIDRGLVTGRAVLDRAPVQVEDLSKSADEFPLGQRAVARFGHKTTLAVPLLREDKALGAILLRRLEARAFTEKQISLLKTFADQAAIAIENVRLFNETKESLEQQTATAEILKVISGTLTDAQPVFEAIVKSCLGLFQGSRVTLGLVDEDHVELRARASDRGGLQGDSKLPLDGTTGISRCIVDSRMIHIPDLDQVADQFPRSRELAPMIGFRSGLFVPLKREGKAIGALSVIRAEAGAFSDKEITLLSTFADQAVIAIENVRLFKEIQAKSRQLEIANKHKSDFLANMSHELRTPLNAIIGFSEVLNERMFGELNEKQADYLKDIHDSGKHLLSLINDILDLSKIEAGHMELEPSDFDVPVALQNALTLVRERAQRHGITLGLRLDPKVGAIRADERKFKQIALNLLSNAVKFTPDGGRVDVSAKMGSSALEVAVSDTGIGIAPEDQALVFEEFKQVGRDYTKKAEGTGLGLALTRRFVELHGGVIRLESSPGKGSTFTFTIPLRA